MNLAHILPAVDKIRKNQKVTDLRSHTYLSTYPNMIEMGKAVKTGSQHFNKLALLIYGWMPRVLRIDPVYSREATESVVHARNATIDSYKSVNIQVVADCLHSLVGASKLLHFINPEIYPIWDSKIQAFLGRSNTNNSMKCLTNYYQYTEEVHSISLEPKFSEFYDDYLEVNQIRLMTNNIAPYKVSKIRAIEASAFELMS